MANSIISNSNTSQNMIQQLRLFKDTFRGDPKQQVMNMLNQGQITNAQLQHAMQIAKQIQHLVK